MSTLLLTTVHTDKIKVEISQNFVAFSEYMNFNFYASFYFPLETQRTQKDKSESIFFETEEKPPETLGHLAIAKPKPPKHRRRPRKRLLQDMDDSGSNFTL